MSQVVLISNLILLETPLEGSELGSRKSIWEVHFGETPHLDSYVLGPFGCLAFLILTKEQRQARGLCGHFGNRTIQDLYLGAHVDAVSGVFRHSLIPTIEQPSAEQAGAHTFDRNMLSMVIEKAKVQKEREV